MTNSDFARKLRTLADEIEGADYSPIDALSVITQTLEDGIFTLHHYGEMDEAMKDRIRATVAFNSRIRATVAFNRVVV